MDTPSCSNVTGRRKRPAIQNDEDGDAFPKSTPFRKVRGNKRINPKDVAPDSLMAKIGTHVDDIINKKKVGSLNCFEYKSPLEEHTIEEMIKAKASIQEMAIVLESAQHVIGYRVDRLHHDVRQIDSAISSGNVARDEAGEDIHLSIESRKAKKQMAVADGMNGLSEYLNKMNDDFANQLNDVEADHNPQWADDDETIAGEPRIDLKANSKDVDLFLERDIFPEDVIREIAISRAANLRCDLAADVSTFISSDDTAHDVKDSNIDWLRANPTFQKATKGSLDNNANSFHSLNYYGIHSPSGRALILHPRIVDKNADDRYFTSDLTMSLAKNTRGLLENALEKKPQILDNYLMLEVKDRPVIGRYKIMSKEVKKSTLPLSEASREKDLANLTFAEMAHRPSNLDMTVAGTSDMSMLPGNQGLPLAPCLNDETLPDRATPSSNQAVSVQHKSANDEYIPPPFEALALEESLIGKLPLDPMDMEKLTHIFDEKLETFKTLDTLESKVWKNGIRAEEWGEDEDSLMKIDIRWAVQSGIEGWIKATDAWTNYDVVKMVVNREARLQLDENAIDEQESYRNMVPEIGRNLFLVKSDDFINNYPGDRLQNLEIHDESSDVMKMWSGEDATENDISLEQIQQEIRDKNNQKEVEVEPIEEMDYDIGGGFDVEFDDRLAAPVDVDELESDTNREGRSAAEILFSDRMDETVEDVRNEQVVQREIENIALGTDEVAELMTSAPPAQLIGPSAEMRDEIRNIGKNDNAHWIAPEIADQEKQGIVAAQRRRREKKAKSRKATVEDFVHYFRDIPDDELERELTAAKCNKIADEKTTFLSEQQLYLPTLGIENKPHVAFEMGLLGSSGLFFKKSYGKIKLERVKNQKTDDDVFIDDTRGNRESDCLNWLLSFSGFRCMEYPEPVPGAESNDNQSQTAQDEPLDDYVNDYYDDDRYDPRWEQQLAASQMGPDMQKKFALAATHINNMVTNFHARKYGEYEDSDDEFDDSFDRQSIQAKNLDAAKHKKCLADILKNDCLSMPSIQFALEQLTLNQTLRLNNTTIRGKPNDTARDETVRSPSPPVDADKTLNAVFEYRSPNKSSHDVNETIKALTEMPDYQEEEGVPDNQHTSSTYGTANTENRKVEIKGCHTLLSLALSMPSKMGENVRPSSIVSFLLHIANENNLQIVQDRSKRSWMSDFIVLNHSESLPRGLVMGKIEEQDDFWKRIQDPDAIEGSATNQNTLFSSLMQRTKAVPARRGRGVAQRVQSPAELGAIAEEEEME